MFGIKRATPLSLPSCFDGSSFFCLAELHHWRHNIAKQLWDIISNDKKYGKEKNILFFKKEYITDIRLNDDESKV